MRGPQTRQSLAGVLDELRLLARVVLPTSSKGILLRRRGVMRVAARLDWDGGAVRFLQHLRRTYGDGPLKLRSPAGPQLLLLSAADTMQVLRGAPEPFSPSTPVKRAALSHFEPHGSLLARGAERGARRQFSDEVLESEKPLHSLAANFLGIVRDEASRLVTSLRDGELTWPRFAECWHAVARRIVLGDAVGSDRALTEQLARLRAQANWVWLPVRKSVKSDYDARLSGYLARAQAGSLAAIIARHSHDDDAHPLDQITHWLFAFDAGAMTTFRALALLASHAGQRARATAEIGAWQNGRADLPYLRACFLDTVRLWPTTPVILRQASDAALLRSAPVGKGTGLIIYVPFFNRDNERLPNADRFDPDFWLGRDPGDAAPFVPFSAGPAACPGRHLVTLVGAAWLAALLDGGRFTVIAPAQLTSLRPLPGTFDHFSIRLRFTRD